MGTVTLECPHTLNCSLKITLNLICKLHPLGMDASLNPTQIFIPSQKEI